MTLLGKTGLIAALALAACGGSSGDDSTSEMIEAATGGTIDLDDGSSVTIPPNALTEDTEVTVSIASLSDYGDLEHGRNKVLSLAPEGLVLEVPASIVLDPGGEALAGDELVDLYQFVDGLWRQPEVSGVEIGSGGTISATVIVFAPTGITVREPPQGPTGAVDGSVFHYYTEQPLPGLTVRVVDGEQTIDSTTTDSNGAFSFEAIPVGAHKLRVDIAAEDNCFGDPTEKAIDVTENEPVTEYFGFVTGPCEGT
jgi:hypothetical protein